MAQNSSLRRSIIAILVSLLTSFSRGQYSNEDQSYIDSLESLIKSSKNDSIKVQAYEALTNMIYVTEPEKDLHVNHAMDSVCSYNLSTTLHPSLKEFFLSKKAFALNNLGAGYHYYGNYRIALRYYTEGLHIQEKLGNQQGIAATLNNIALIQQDLGNTDRALEFQQQSYDILLAQKDSLGMAGLLNNIGVLWAEKGDTVQSQELYRQSLAIRRAIKDEIGIATTLNNIGGYYSVRGQKDTALFYFLESLEIYERLGDQANISFTLNAIGDAHFYSGDYSEAAKFNKRALEVAQSCGSAWDILDAARSLYNDYKKLGMYQQALEMHELYVVTEDSIKSESAHEELIRQEYLYEFEKDSIKAAETKKVQQAELDAEKAKSERRAQQNYILYGGLFLTVLFGFIIYKRLRITRKQKLIIEEQKEEVEQQKKEIIDSINYAKRIQSAILPPDKVFKEKIPDSFIIYKPKDIVAGDFYWLEDKNGTVLFAVADCTGHGVPGAMVSVVCNNALNRSVREHGLTDPGEILNKTREIILSEFEKSEEGVKDGMDIALVALAKQKTLVKYAGAHNPLWIIRKGSEEIEEIKANKQPIGKFQDVKDFVTHELNINKGDQIYIFSDGFADQFGGDKGKKLKSSNLKSLLLSVKKEEMSQQGIVLDQKFEEWRGEFEQLDDVCLIGVRF